MEEERVTLSAGEQGRVVVLNHLEKGAVTVGEAAGLLGISERQVKRIRADYRREGAAALPHGNRGRRPGNAAEMGLTRRVVELATTTYQGFNRHHLTEMLAEREEIHVSRATVDRWLRAAGVPGARKPGFRSSLENLGSEARFLSSGVEPRRFLDSKSVGTGRKLVDPCRERLSLVPS
jgi:transposase